MRLLPDDKYTSGVLSQTVVNTWKARQASEQYYVTREQLRRLHRVVEDSKNKVFDKVVETLYVPFNALPPSVDEEGIFITGLIKDTKFDGVELESQHVKFFDHEGFLLHDGMYASAFGNFKYIYRSKGMRLFWMRNQTIKVCAVYSMIDDDGFSLSHEEVSDANLQEGGATNLFTWVSSKPFQESINYSEIGDAYFWVKALSNINIAYERVYFLEYLLNPTDVHQLSTFSVNVRSSLWQSIFNYAYEIFTDAPKEEERDLFRFSLDFMRLVSVEPPPAELITFTEQMLRARNQGITNEELLTLLHEIQQHTRTTAEALVPKSLDAIEELSEFKLLTERQTYRDIYVKNNPQENIARGFLQNFLKARSYREVQTRGGNTDILTFSKAGRYLYEAKIWKGEAYHKQGLREIEEYIMGEGDDEELQGIYYVIFDPTSGMKAQEYLKGEWSTDTILGKKVDVLVVNIALPKPSKKL